MSWFFTKNELTIVIEQPSPRELYEKNVAELTKLNEQLATAEKAITEHCRIHKDPRVHFVFALAVGPCTQDGTPRTWTRFCKNRNGIAARF